MPLILPRILPNFVDDYKGGSYGLLEFSSDSDITTRVVTSARSSGLILSIKYFGLNTEQIGMILDFLRDCKLDWRAGVSYRSFEVPRNHPLWRRVHALAAIERTLLLERTIDDARWVIRNPAPVKVVITGLHEWAFDLTEVQDF